MTFVCNPYIHAYCTTLDKYTVCLNSFTGNKLRVGRDPIANRIDILLFSIELFAPNVVSVSVRVSAPVLRAATAVQTSNRKRK